MGRTRGRSIHPANHVLLQRRAGLILGLAAPGGLRAQGRPVARHAQCSAPPYSLVDNSNTLLDVTDLVFIDPVAPDTAAPPRGSIRKSFTESPRMSRGRRLHPAVYDALWPLAIAEVSCGRKLRHHERRRTFGLSARSPGHLLERHCPDLIRPQFRTIRFDDGNDLPYALFLPTYTATAWYHKKLPADLQAGGLAAAIAEAERFARSDYPQALMEGDKLPEAKKQEIVRKVARLTGLSEDYVRCADLRIEIQHFCKELLRDQRKTVGRYDSRFEGVEIDAVSERPEFDPSYTAVQGAFTATMNQYLRSELHVENEMHYEILTGKVQPWNFGTAQNQYLNVAPTLRSAMTKNRNLRLFVAAGYYDLATPFAGADHSIAHLGFGPGVAHERHHRLLRGGSHDVRSQALA